MRKIVAATYRVLATVHVASGKNIFLSERHFYQDLKILAKLGHVSLQEISEKNRININISLTRLRVVSGKTISRKIIFESWSRILKWAPVLLLPEILSRMSIPCDNHKWKSLKLGPGFLSISSFTCLQKVLAHYLLSHFYNSEILVKVFKRLSIHSYE